MNVVLASQSPQRRRLLRELVEEFEVVVPDVDEDAHGQTEAVRLACALAEAKAHAVAARRPDALVIGADTVVECEGEIIGKPADRDDAVRILSLLTSRPHHIVTGLCVVAPDGEHRPYLGADVTKLRMRPMTRAEIEHYVDTEDVLGRAGAYGLKELDPNIESIEGSASSVMGLPLESLEVAIRKLGCADVLKHHVPE